MFELKLENDSNQVVDINDHVNYVVLNVSGLNPPSASMFTAASPNKKGVKYNGSRLNERNILITIKILGDIESNRNALYDFIDTENYIKINYQNGLKNVYCEGHVTDCDIDFFTNNETIGLAVICEDPYWKDLQEISVDMSNVLKQFTFPFAISEPVPFSTIKNNSKIKIFNSGSETGVLIRINCINEVNGVEIYNPTNIYERFEINTTLPKGSLVIINTESSPKTVKLYKPDGSSAENLLKYINKNATWFTLKRGNNFFAYNSVSESANDVEISVNFKNKYLGV